MTKRRVAFIFFDINKLLLPLAYEYLTGYALADPDVEANWDFEYYSDYSFEVSPPQMESRMDEIDADVYAFSCYAWNMGLIREGIYRYLRKNPKADIIMGGPQVTFQGERYLRAEYENLVICDGEGERTFRSYLKELMNISPDFSRVRGISFYKSNSLHTIPNDRIKELDEIPSPYLNKFFKAEDKEYEFFYTVLETNRGCPFSCKFCTWGSLGVKPAMFSEERVRSDIEWLARQGFAGLYFLDANFGLYPRDLEITKFIVECKKKYGAPEKIVFLNAYSNSRRLAEIYKTLADAGIHLTCVLSLQSMGAAALDAIGRKAFDSLEWLQNCLIDSHIDSYGDILWPIPGETLSSLRESLAKLSEIRTNFFIVPLALLNNSGFQKQKEEYGIIAIQATDINHEAELVVQTDEVGPEDYVRGWEFIFSATALQVFGGLCLTARYLHESGIEQYDTLFSKFADFAMSKPDMPLIHSVELLIGEKRMDVKSSYDNIIFDICHENRDVFDLRLFEFASSQPWWNDMPVRLYFEADLINRLHLISNQVREKKFDFQIIRILGTFPDRYIIEIPHDYIEPLSKLIGNKADFTSNRVQVSHLQSQFAQVSSLNKVFSNLFNQAYMPRWKNHA